MNRNPSCAGCELRCDLTATKDQITQAIAEVGSPVQEAEFRADIARYDVEQDSVDRELRDMVGQTGFDDPEATLTEAQKSHQVARELTDASTRVVRALDQEATSRVLSFGPGHIRSINANLQQLSSNEMFCRGPRRGVTLPMMGFVALGFGPSKDCGSPVAPLGRSTLAEIKKDAILPE